MPLSKTHRSRLNKAIKIAGLSEEFQKHGAAIYKGGSLMSVGVNVIKNDPFIVGTDAVNPNHHAETMAIRATKADLRGAVIYVARINNSGKPMMSRPCKTCREAIALAGIRKIVYTVDGEEEVMIRD